MATPHNFAFTKRLEHEVRDVPGDVCVHIPTGKNRAPRFCSKRDEHTLVVRSRLVHLLGVRLKALALEVEDLDVIRGHAHIGKERRRIENALHRLSARSQVFREHLMSLRGKKSLGFQSVIDVLCSRVFGHQLPPLDVESISNGQ